VCVRDDGGKGRRKAEVVVVVVARRRRREERRRREVCLGVCVCVWRGIVLMEMDQVRAGRSPEEGSSSNVHTRLASVCVCGTVCVCV
jgi:hypothetical protein